MTNVFASGGRMKSCGIYILSGLVVLTIGIFAGESEAVQIQDLIVVASNSDLPAGVTAVAATQGVEQVSLLPEDAEIAELESDSG